MKTEKFNEIVRERCNKIQATLAHKAVEYTVDDNRLHNFDRGVRLTGRTREQVIHGMLLKHEISVLDIIDNMEKDIYPSVELLDEKLGDYINYLILLEASIKDKIKQNENPV